MARVERSKIAPNVLGDPRAILGEKERVLVGTIIGRATDIVIRKDPAGEQQFKGLSGEFEAIPATKDAEGNERDTVFSGVCFLPGGIHERYIAPLEQRDATGKRTVEAVEFALELYAVKANNPQKYSWEARSAFANEEPVRDTLSDLRNKMKALPAAKSEPAKQIPQGKAK